MTLGEWLRMASARLTHSGITSASIEAQIIAGHVLNVNRAFVLAHPELQIHESRFEPLLDRRANLEPLAYLIGWREFFGRRFCVSPAVLIPRQETELLVEDALFRYSTDSHLHVLDVGTGSGAIAITLKLERPTWEIMATDISESALEVARNNAAKLEAEVEFVLTDLFPPSATGFDLIVSNPPYVALGDEIGPDVIHEPVGALYAGEDGLDVYRRLALEARPYLRAEGEIILEIGAGQTVDVIRIFENQSWTHRETCKDLAGIERVLSFLR